MSRICLFKSRVLRLLAAFACFNREFYVFRRTCLFKSRVLSCMDDFPSLVVEFPSLVVDFPSLFVDFYRFWPHLFV